MVRYYYKRGTARTCEGLSKDKNKFKKFFEDFIRPDMKARPRGATAPQSTEESPESGAPRGANLQKLIESYNRTEAIKIDESDKIQERDIPKSMRLLLHSLESFMPRPDDSPDENEEDER